MKKIAYVIDYPDISNSKRKAIQRAKRNGIKEIYQVNTTTGEILTTYKIKRTVKKWYYYIYSYIGS